MESRVSSRLQQLNSHVEANATLNNGTVSKPSDDDVVIVGYARTAMTKAKRGAQKDTAPEAMLQPVLEAVVKQAGIKASQVDDVVVGNVL